MTHGYAETSSVLREIVDDFVMDVLHAKVRLVEKLVNMYVNDVIDASHRSVKRYRS